MYIFAGYFLFLLFVDKLVLKKANWYILHTITNALVVVFTVPDVINILLNPYYIAEEPNMYGMDIAMVLHIYHMLIYKNLMLIDWVHHIVMMVILSFPYYYIFTVAITNYLLFFLTGLPGGIDYLMLSLVKYGKIDRNTEKFINSKLNVWLRGPGIIVGAYIVFLQYIHPTIEAHFIVFLIAEVGLIWNAQYFTERVLSNYVYKMNFQITQVKNDLPIFDN